MMNPKDPPAEVREIDFEHFASQSLSAEKVVRFHKIFATDLVEVNGDLHQMVESLESMEYFLNQYQEFSSYDKELFYAEFSLCSQIMDVFWHYFDSTWAEAKRKNPNP